MADSQSQLLHDEQPSAGSFTCRENATLRWQNALLIELVNYFQFHSL
jgi:hypothetical protein